MEEHLDREPQTLRVYIAYDDFFSAEQLSAILSSLDRLYTSLYIAYAPETPLPLPLEARMRVKECRTGNSIWLELMEGIRQIWDVAGPTIQVTGAMGVTAAMARLIVGFARGFAEFRKTWYEGSQAKYEAEKAKHEAERLKREIEKEQREKRPAEKLLDLSGIPEAAKRQASEAIIQFLALTEYSPNIVVVQINETRVLDKRASPKQ
jgi:hypothetical protein